MKPNLFRQYCLESTIQSLKYFYLYPDRVSRCFWTFFIMFATLLAFSLASQLYNRFAQNPTRITIEDQFTPVTHLPYPAITMCSPNQIHIQNVQHFNRTLIDGNLNIDLLRAVPQLLGFYETLPSYDVELLKHLQELILANRHTIPEVVTSLAQTCTDFLTLCFFEDELVSCDELFHPIVTKHGLCCIFNSPYSFVGGRVTKDRNFVPKYPQVGGIEAGLMVASDYHPMLAVDGTLLHAGATRMMFTDHTEYPSDDESCTIYGNVETFITMKGTHTTCSEDVKTLPSDSRRCLFEHEGSPLTLPMQGYRNSDCDLMCEIRALEAQCHCWPLYMPGFRRGQLCNLTDIPCITQTKVSLPQLPPHLATCECPRDCDSRHYQVNVNLGNLGALEYLINNPFYMLNFNLSSSITHFAFANTFYVKQKQETVMSLINLVSNLGGVFGLCLGFSAFSVLEIVFFIYKSICIRIKMHRLSKRKNHRKVKY